MGKKAIKPMLLGCLLMSGATQACAGNDGAPTFNLKNDAFAHSDSNYTNAFGITCR